MRNLSRLARTTRRAAVLGALGAATLLPAVPAHAASAWQFEQFRWAGGSRFTLTVSKQQQLPGIPATVWPKGYRFLCKFEGPLIRFRMNYTYQDDFGVLETAAQYATPGSLSYTKLGVKTSANIFAAPGTAPITSTYTPNLPYMVAGATTGLGKAPLSPPLGLLDLQILPMSEYKVLPPFNLYLQAATLQGKLDVRQGTAAECPQPTGIPFAYFRARS